MARRESFRLRPLLDYKSSVVELLEAEFARLKAAYDREVATLLELQAVERAEMDALRLAQRGRLDCAAILARQQYLEVVGARVAEQQRRVQEALRQLEAKREELVEAMQDQQSLEKLRERHEARELKALDRREARAVDELVTARYRREA